MRAFYVHIESAVAEGEGDGRMFISIEGPGGAVAGTYKQQRTIADFITRSLNAALEAGAFLDAP